MSQSLSIFAQVVGPVILIGSLGLLANKHKIDHILREYTTSEALRYMVNIIRMIIGLLIITIIPLSSRIHVVIHVIGWTALVFATGGILFPEVNTHSMRLSLRQNKAMHSMISIGVVIGVGLCYIGYMM